MKNPLSIPEVSRTRLAHLKKGQWFRFVTPSTDQPQKKVYTYEGKARVYNGWGDYKGWGFAYTPHDDVWGGGKDTITNRLVTTIIE